MCRWMAYTGAKLFVHNGEVFEIEKLRRDLLFAIAPELFPCILGTTDSEAMFYLALTFGLGTDPLGALARMTAFIEEIGRAHGVDETRWMTVAVSDGKSLYAVRYASDSEAPSLYHSRDMDDIYQINPEVRQVLSRSTRLIVSEPVGRYAEMWAMVPPSSSIQVVGESVEIQPFAPTLA